MNIQRDPDLLTRQEAAAILGKSTSALAHGFGPPPLPAYRRPVYYSRQILQQWLAGKRGNERTLTTKGLRIPSAKMLAATGGTGTGIVYFLRSSGPGEPTKIGWTVNLRERMRSLTTASPYELRLLEAWRGTPQIEAELHWTLRKHQLRGEWFSCGALIDVLLKSKVSKDLSVMGEL